MSDFDIAVEKVLDEDNDVELEKEQGAMDGAESFAKHPRYKIPSLDEAIALLIAVQNIGLANESKVDPPLNGPQILFLLHIVQIQ